LPHTRHSVKHAHEVLFVFPQLYSEVIAPTPQFAFSELVQYFGICYSLKKLPPVIFIFLSPVALLNLSVSLELV